MESLPIISVTPDVTSMQMARMTINGTEVELHLLNVIQLPDKVIIGIKADTDTMNNLPTILKQVADRITPTHK